MALSVCVNDLVVVVDVKEMETNVENELVVVVDGDDGVVDDDEI